MYVLKGSGGAGDGRVYVGATKHPKGRQKAHDDGEGNTWLDSALSVRPEWPAGIRAEDWPAALLEEAVETVVAAADSTTALVRGGPFVGGKKDGVCGHLFPREEAEFHKLVSVFTKDGVHALRALLCEIRGKDKARPLFLSTIKRGGRKHI